MTRPRVGEALFWAGLVVLLAACCWHELSGNQFLLMFGAGAAVMFGGLYLMHGGRR